MATDSASGADRSDKSSDNQSSGQADKADKAERAMSEKSRDALSPERSKPDAAVATAQTRADSQEKMQSEGRIAKGRVEPPRKEQAAPRPAAYDGPAPEGSPDAPQTDVPAPADPAVAEQAAVAAREIVAAHTVNTGALNLQTGGDIVHVNSQGIAEDLMAMARTDPPAVVEETYTEVLQSVPHPDDVVAAVSELQQQEVAASASLLGDSTFTPPDLAQVDAAATALMAPHTGTDGSVDVETLGYDIEAFAAENPSLAVGARAEIASRLSGAQAADLNRQIAGDRHYFESLELAVENPGQGAIGIGKQLVNVVTGTAELGVNVLSRIEEARLNVRGAVFDVVGADGWAQANYAQSDRIQEARLARDWSLDMANGAQQGGANIVTTAEIAAAGYGLARGGVRLADEGVEFLETAARNADEVPTTGLRYTDEAIQSFDYGAHLRREIGPPPTRMHDPHAHHVLFKKGNGARQQALVTEGQNILRQYDIDPIYGFENLGWAPNRVAGQHSIDALSPLVDDLRSLHQSGVADREDMVRVLEEYLAIAAARGN